MDMRGLVITIHAKTQFVKRWTMIAGKPPKSVNGSLQNLLQKAKRDKINPWIAVTRMQRHGRESEYYSTEDGWRFIVVQGDNGTRVLVTVERIAARQNYIKEDMDESERDSGLSDCADSPPDTTNETR